MVPVLSLLPGTGLLPFPGLLPGVDVGAEAVDELYPPSIAIDAVNDFAPLTDAYGDENGHLDIYLSALASMFQATDDISKDGPNGEPGWSQIFDLNRAKIEWLPWAGQLVGYQVPVQPLGQSDDDYSSEQRVRITSRSSWRRGTVALFTEVIQEQLTGQKRVLIQERYAGDPYAIKAWVYADEVATSVAQITATAMQQKVAGLIFEFTVLTAVSSYDTLRAAQTSYAVASTKFVDYSEMLVNPAKP